MKDLQLQEFKVESFLRIDQSCPVVIDFAENKSKGVTLLKGDNKIGKTSTLTALMLMMGATFDIDAKNFTNLKDETTKVDLKFVYDGSNYHAILSGGRLTLKKQYKEANGKWMPEGSPKEMLRMIFGNLGVSPMFLKSMEGKKQIQWFKDTFGNDEEAGKKETKVISDLKKVTDERKDTNREIKALKGWLDLSELFTNYEKNAKRFEKPINADKEKKKFDELSDQKGKYDQYATTVAIRQGEVRDKERKVADLQKQLEVAIKERDEMKELLEKGEKWLEEKKPIVKEYDEANAAWLNLSKTLSEQNTWKEVLAKEKEYNEALQLNIDQNGSIDQLRKDLLKITKSYLPKIEGLEIRVKVALDDEDEGIYYNGLTLAQLSESEIWDLFIRIWEDYEVRFIFCENINGLGSDAIKTMNRLVKDKKAKILATEMERGKTEMTVSFESKIV